MRSLASVILAASLACAPRTSPVAATPRIAPAELAARLAEADRLTSRGCYLCLKEAASAYAALLALSDDPTLASRALENNLMLALREVELRMPDSGALEAAGALRARVPGYDAYFDALDRLGRPVVAGEVTMPRRRSRRPRTRARCAPTSTCRSRSRRFSSKTSSRRSTPFWPPVRTICR